MNDDLISRQAAIDTAYPFDDNERHLIDALEELPSAQPTEASCWGCNCPKMERLNEQKTFSEMVHLHNAETHSCDLISRQAAIDETWKEPSYTDPYNVLTEVRERIQSLPSAQPELVEKAAYIRGFEQGRTQGMIDSQS